MANEWIEGWESEATPGSVSGPPTNYGGAHDWIQIWSEEVNGGVTMTQVQLDLRAAPGLNWATQVAWTKSNDAPLLAQNLAADQLPGDRIYPVTRRTGAPTSSGSFSWNGFAWVGTNEV